MVKEPSPFWQEGELGSATGPKRSIAEFLHELNTFFLLEKVTTDTIKKLYLDACLGIIGRRRSRGTLADTDTFETQTAALVKLFTRKKSIHVIALSFERRAQSAGESIDEFVGELQCLLREMEITGPDADRRLIHKIFRGIRSDSLRESLLALPEDVTLSDVLTKCRASEASTHDARELSHSAHVNHMQTNRNPSNKNKQLTCYKCKKVGHIATNCRSKMPQNRAQSQAGRSQPAGTSGNTSQNQRFTGRCYVCDIPGHRAVDCRKRQNRQYNSNQTVNSNQPVNQVSLVQAGTQPTPEQTASVNPTTRGGGEIYKLNQSQESVSDLIWKEVILQGVNQNHTLSMMVDTGATVNVIPKADCIRLGLSWSGSQAVSLRCYGGNSISVLGTMQLMATGPSGTPHLTHFMVTEEGKPLLGIPGIRKLIAPGEDCLVINNLFSKDPGLDTTASVHITLKRDAEPMQQRARPLPVSVRTCVQDALDDMVSQGVLEHIPDDETPSWLSPIVVIVKKQSPEGQVEKVRICADLRELNKAIVLDRHPMPSLEEMTTTLVQDSAVGELMFSKLDFTSAYHHLPMDSASSKLLAIATPFGNFRYKRLIFGLANAPAIFQRYLESVLQNIPGVTIYLDDVVIQGNPAEHDLCLKEVLQRIESRGLKLSQAKCAFRQSEIEFLGHRITSAGKVFPLTKNTERILSMPIPETGKLMRSALGSFGFYARFVKNFSAKASVLRGLTGELKITHDDETREAWESLKTALAEATIKGLACFKPGGANTKVITDASDTALSGILQQNGQPIAFYSRVLGKTEMQFSIGEKEALAIIESVERWHVFLYGAPFTVVTDHRPLITLLAEGQGRRTTMRLKRWGARLMAYQFELSLITSAENPADIYSRLQATVITETERVLTLTIESDEHLILAEFISKGFPDKAKWPTELRWLYNDRDLMSINDGHVYVGHRRLLPEEEREEVLALAHEGHPGTTRMKALLREGFCWATLASDVQNVVRQCKTCQLDKSAKPNDTPVHKTHHPELPFHTVGIDTLGPYAWGSAIVLQDYFSKWPEVMLVRTVNTESVIQFLQTVFATHGSPTVLISDNASYFVSHQMQEYLRAEKVLHHTTTPYNPRSNGLVERFNQTLISVFQQHDYKSALRAHLRAYRITPHTTTGVSPCKLAMGRTIRTPLTAVYGQLPSPPEAEVIQLEPGTRVRVKRIGLLPKGALRWETETCFVARATSRNSFVLSDGRRVPGWRLSRAYGDPPPPSATCAKPPDHTTKLTPYTAPTENTTNPDSVPIESAETAPPETNREPEPLPVAPAIRMSSRQRRPPDRLDL
jgi:hypothetical protein